MKLIFTLIVLCFSIELMAQKAGTLDSSFGVDGKVLTSSATAYLECTAATSLNDGSIICAGVISIVDQTGGFLAMNIFQMAT